MLKGLRFSIRSMSKDSLEAVPEPPASPTIQSARGLIFSLYDLLLLLIWAFVSPCPDLIKVFMTDETHKTLEIGPMHTGKEALEMAVSRFNKPNEEPLVPDHFDLCELKSDGGSICA